MARLPAPIVTELGGTYEEGHQTLEKSLYKVLGGIIRKEESKERMNEGEKSES